MQPSSGPKSGKGVLRGEIPGAEFLRDTRNFPWHRPPQHNNLDQALEDIYKKMLSKEISVGIITMLEMGTTVCAITDMLLMKGIQTGKWTVDFALLLAGPVAHIIYLMGEGYGVKSIDMGYNEPGTVPTSSYIKAMKKVNFKESRKALFNVNLQAIEQQAEGHAAPETPPSSGLPKTGLGGMAAGGPSLPPNPIPPQLGPAPSIAPTPAPQGNLFGQ